MILKDDYKFIGPDLRKIRESKGISRREISEKVYISEETIRRIEKGENDPRLSTLIPICNCLGIEIDKLELLYTKNTDDNIYKWFGQWMIWKEDNILNIRHSSCLGEFLVCRLGSEEDGIVI